MNFTCMKLNIICLKLNFVCMKLNIINSKSNCTRLESNFSSMLLKYHTIFCIFFSQPVKSTNPAICFCYFNTEGRLHLWNILAILVVTDISFRYRNVTLGISESCNWLKTLFLKSQDLKAFVFQKIE